MCISDSYKHEAGIFYIKYPEQKNGFIFSITDKIFPEVTGDGKSSLAELILQDKRARLIAIKYFNRHKNKLNDIIPANKNILLVGAGDHTQGAEFKDGYKKIYSPELMLTFDNMAKKMPDFYFGRFDVRYKSLEEFKQGKGFKIIEVNGATSEATHIHDVDINIFEAYKTLYMQTKYLYEIAYINHKKGVKCISYGFFLKQWIKFLRMSAKYKASY